MGDLKLCESSIRVRIKNALNWRRPRLWVTAAAIVLCIAVLAACAADPPDTGDDPSIADDPVITDVPDEDFDVQTLLRPEFWIANETGPYLWLEEDGTWHSGGHIAISFAIGGNWTFDGEFLYLREGWDVNNNFLLTFRPEGPWLYSSEYGSIPEKLVFCADRSENAGAVDWFTDGMVLVRTVYGQEGSAVDRYPEFCGLDTSHGLHVFAYQMAHESYSFILTPGGSVTDPGMELLDRRGCSAAEMKEILATYDLPDDWIRVSYFYMLYSSYINPDAMNEGFGESLRQMLGLE